MALLQMAIGIYSLVSMVLALQALTANASDVQNTATSNWVRLSRRPALANVTQQCPADA